MLFKKISNFKKFVECTQKKLKQGIGKNIHRNLLLGFWGKKFGQKIMKLNRLMKKGELFAVIYQFL
jgi:hypothetical protein